MLYCLSDLILSIKIKSFFIIFDNKKKLKYEYLSCCTINLK